jgi:hypothetical protein
MADDALMVNQGLAKDLTDQGPQNIGVRFRPVNRTEKITASSMTWNSKTEVRPCAPLFRNKPHHNLLLPADHRPPL